MILHLLQNKKKFEQRQKKVNKMILFAKRVRKIPEITICRSKKKKIQQEKKNSQHNISWKKLEMSQKNNSGKPQKLPF